MIGNTFNATVKQFIETLMQSLPQAAPEDLYWGYNFLPGAPTLSLAESGRLDVLSDGLCHSADVAALRARLGPFVAAGLRGLAQRRARAQRARGDDSGRPPRATRRSSRSQRE